jgi:hypothetical protein
MLEPSKEILIGEQGRKPDPPSSGLHLLKLDASPQFTYLFNPQDWGVQWREGQPILLPGLRELRWEPGLSGVDQVKNSLDGNAIRAIAILVAAGWTEIPRHAVRAWGAEKPDYCLRYDGYRGAIHLPAWRRPLRVGPKTETEWDQIGYVDWLSNLVGSFLPEITDSVKRSIAVRMERTMRRLRSNDRNATAMAHADQYEQALVAFEGPSRRRSPEPEVVRESPSVGPSINDQILAMLQGLSAQNAALSARLDEQGSALAAIQSRGKPGPKPPVAPLEEKAV